MSTSVFAYILPTETDNYGDFWFRGLETGAYTVPVEKEGFLSQKLGPVDASDKDVNLGDIALWRD